MLHLTDVAPSWLVFVHQLPAHPSNGRVKIWRRLQQIGAVALKNAVHVLPDSAQSLEDFEWLREEVIALGGEASLVNVSSMSKADERYIVGELDAARTRELGKRKKELKVMQSRSGPAGSRIDPEMYRARVWVTRPRPGVDRFASAWLIRRFIDREARFAFASAPDKHP
ncbi:MAG: chromate resistance protein ChrB domain-containing protein, partial [Vicinamibacterales bacterium]